MKWVWEIRESTKNLTVAWKIFFWSFVLSLWSHGAQAQEALLASNSNTVSNGANQIEDTEIRKYPLELGRLLDSAVIKIYREINGFDVRQIKYWPILDSKGNKRRIIIMFNEWKPNFTVYLQSIKGRKHRYYAWLDATRVAPIFVMTDIITKLRLGSINETDWAYYAYLVESYKKYYIIINNTKKPSDNDLDKF